VVHIVTTGLSIVNPLDIGIEPLSELRALGAVSVNITHLSLGLRRFGLSTAKREPRIASRYFFLGTPDEKRPLRKFRRR
jgi:hypothetical protein